MYDELSPALDAQFIALAGVMLGSSRHGAVFALVINFESTVLQTKRFFFVAAADDYASTAQTQGARSAL
jgi:hypothetical protein